MGVDVGVLCVCGLGIMGDVSVMVVVDGVEFIMSSVDFNDIENIFILKDVVVLVIYGVCVVNGVIFIIIKKGIKGCIIVLYDGYVGW